MLAAVKSSLQCRLCRRISVYVLLSILAIEAVILLPSYNRHERDLMGRLHDSAQSAVEGAFVGKAGATEHELLQVVHQLTERKMIAGGVLYRADGSPVGNIGTVPELSPVIAKERGKLRTRSHDGDWCDILWTPARLGVPFSFVGRVDARWIAEELTAFVWRVIGLVLLISGVVCAATMAVVGRTVLAPLLKLRSNLAAASQDPDNVDRYTLKNTFSDELGEVVGATNRLLEQVAAAHRDSLFAMTAMADQAADAILAYDDRGDILYANRACLKMVGFSGTKAMKKAALPRFEFGEDTKPASLPDSLRSGAYSREATLLGNDGRRVAVVINAARVPRSSRSPIRYYASISDISALRDAQNQLEQQNVELRAASKAKSEFLANMSHELRTPLNAVIGFSAAFVNGLFGPLGDQRYQEYAQDINDSGNHLLRIINDILDLSKIEAGHMQLTDSQLRIPQIVNSVLPLVRERAAEANVRMTMDVPDDLPPLRADDRAVKQMLINLLSNAVKFTDAGGEIRVAAMHDDGAIRLSVTDTGIGMAPEDIPRALTAFGQVDGSLSRRHQGTGLGLPLVKSLVELHQGHCTIDSAPGIGTTVTLHFPKERTIYPSADAPARSVA